jgi:hypothetical protein
VDSMLPGDKLRLVMSIKTQQVSMPPMRAARYVSS